jgi:hypothetical protein
MASTNTQPRQIWANLATCRSLKENDAHEDGEQIPVPTIKGEPSFGYWDAEIGGCVMIEEEASERLKAVLETRSDYEGFWFETFDEAEAVMPRHLTRERMLDTYHRACMEGSQSLRNRKTLLIELIPEEDEVEDYIQWRDDNDLEPFYDVWWLLLRVDEHGFDAEALTADNLQRLAEDADFYARKFSQRLWADVASMLRDYAEKCAEVGTYSLCEEEIDTDYEGEKPFWYLSEEDAPTGDYDVFATQLGITLLNNESDDE